MKLIINLENNFFQIHTNIIQFYWVEKAHFCVSMHFPFISSNDSFCLKFNSMYWDRNPIRSFENIFSCLGLNAEKLAGAKYVLRWDAESK